MAILYVITLIGSMFLAAAAIAGLFPKKNIFIFFEINFKAFCKE